MHKERLLFVTMLSEAEANYLKSQRLARVATVSPKGTPEVSPVGFRFDGEYFWIGSHSQEIFPTTRRVKNIMKGNSRVSLVVDDLVSVDPWKPRGVKVSGTAEVVEHDGMFGKGKYIRIKPSVTVSWGIEPPKGRTEWASVKRWS
jgi:pyridoxamine 5'-phosphate oxidase family protein